MRALILLVLFALAGAWPVAAAPNLFGEPGLILTPTADATPHGDLAFGVNTVDEAFRRYPNRSGTLTIAPRATVVHYVHVGLLPGIAVTAGFANFHGKLFARYFDPVTDPLTIRPHPDLPQGQRMGGWPIDRSVGVRFQLARQGRGWPAVALGLRDSDGNSVFGANYLVASRRFGSSPRPGTPLGLGLHLGYGKASRTSVRYGNGILDGVFGGVDYWPSTRYGFLAEFTPRDFHLGARWNVTRQLQLQPSLFGLRWFGGGISLSSRM